MKKIFLLISSLVFIHSLTAQTLENAVRFSVFDVNSTARSVGVGGGLGALGADFSTLSVNPAGLAQYRSREFTFTPSLVFIDSEATLADGDQGTQERSKVNFNFSNIGLVFARRPTSRVWKTANFGMGFNRVANFHQKVNYEGTTRGSIIDRWIELAETRGLDAFESGLAVDVNAISESNTNPGLYLADLFPDDQVLKSQEITRKGAINELVFAFAGNIKERVMLGATIGIPFLKYEENKTYRESDPTDQYPGFSSLRFNERIDISGTGINLKLGAILRVNQVFRVGAAIHTPTSFQLTDNLNTTAAYDFDDASQSLPPANSPADLAELKYNYQTPWRFIGSAGIVIGKIGFLTGEMEYVNYANNKYSVDQDVEFPADQSILDAVNDKVTAELESNLNFRFGGEIALNSLRLRGGLNLSGTPYAEDTGLDSSLSLGAGMRWERIFLDVAYRRIMNNEVYVPYVISDKEVGGVEISEQSVNIDDIRNKFMITMGVRF